MENNIAPNGKPSNLTNEQYKLVRTKAFKDWFGDWENDPENASKVVDENGEPLVVYRGWSSNNKFGNVFGYRKNLWGNASVGSSRKSNRFGFYFSTDKKVAKIYADDFAQAYNDDLEHKGSSKEKAIPIVQEYFLKIQNVCDISPSNKDFPSLKSKISDVQKVLKQKSLQEIRETEIFNYTTSIGTKSLSKIVGFKLNDIQLKSDDLYERRFQSNYPHEIYSYMINDGDGMDIVLKDALIENEYDGVRFEEFTHYYQSLSKKEKIEFDKNEKNGLIQHYPLVYVVFDSTQIKLADGTNTTFDGRNPDIRYDEGGRVEHLIREGIVDLKMYDTTPEHAKEYGLKSINPLYIQTICVSEPKRLKGLGKKVLAYIEKYAIENGHDVVFGNITQKAEFTKDERETLFCDIDMIKNWLSSNGYAINDDNNDFHKFISHSNPDIRYKNGGTMKKVNMDFGKYAFTDKDENEEVAKTAIKIQKGKHEENTTQENDILNKISDWLYRSDNKTSQKIKELKPIFDVAKKKYPKIFNPKQGVKLLYRGVAELRKEKDIPQDISSYTYVDLGGKNFYLSNQPFDYKPSRDTQSWTSDIEKATSFAQDAMLITLVGNDFYFNSDLIDSIFMEERETIHIGKKFEHKVFVALSPSLYYELVEKNTRKPKKAIDEINKLKFANGGTMESIGDGGITYGKSHAEGGIKVYNKGTGQMLEVEGGESVVNKKTMAMKDKVDLNGEKMTPCEAISELNQMGGGVAFECSDVEGKKYKMADGGELQKGIQQEMEHAKTFEKLYRHKITPKEAPAEIAKEHLMEDEDYYKDLRKIRHSCSCQKHRRKMMDGGIFDKGFGSLDSFMENFEKKMDEDEKKEIIDETISVGREMLDHDYKSVIMERIEPSLQKYFAHLNHANLYKSGWRLQFGTSKRWAGLCSSQPKTNEKGIFISIDFVKHDKNWLQNYKDVVYHEMAHAMVVQFVPQVNSIDPFHKGQEGHGMVWTNVCKALNPEGVCERYYKNSNFAESFKDYMYSCRTCGAKKYGNTRAFTDICFKCKSPVIVVRNK